MKRNKTFKKLTIILALFATGFTANAQESDVDFSVALTSDQFFGVAPSFGMEYKLTEKIGASVYGILWGAGTGGAWGNWTEFGGGVNLYLAEGITLNPNLGFTFGNLLSRGGESAGIIGDGIVPNLFFNVDIPKFESEIYFGYYAPLRNEAPTTTLAYIHYWANAGYKVSDAFSFGGHFEQLTNSGGSNVESSSDVFQWIGPYVQFNAGKSGAFVRLAGGTDIVSGNDSFYKLSTGFSF